MGEVTGIAWTDSTFNPWIGCQRVSPGCVNCYAEAQDHRWGHDRWGPDKPRPRTSVAYWKKPVDWNKRAALAGKRHRVFCASLADVFEDRNDLDVPRIELFDLIRRAALEKKGCIEVTPRSARAIRLTGKGRIEAGWYE